MARSRNIKPGFFLNDEIAELDALARLLALGLPCIADRLGRLQNRPKRIKAELLPYDNFDVDAALDGLEQVGFIQRYTADNTDYIQIVKFEKHQNPHKNEAESVIPEQPKHSTSTVQAPDKHSSNRADSLLLIPDSLKHPCASGDALRTANRFEEWWKSYPVKKNKKAALAKWKARSLDRIGQTLIDDTKKRSEQDGDWIRGFIPLPTTYINGDRWEDEIAKPRVNGDSKPDWAKIPRADDSLWGFAKSHGYDNPGTMNYFQYRQHLQGQVNARLDREQA